MSLFSLAEKRASLTSPAETWGRDVFAAPRETAAGVDVTYDSARTLTAVWACQSLIADGLAALPVDIIRTDSMGRRKSVSRPRWLDRPNPFDTWFSFVHKTMISLLGSSGNAYVLVVRASSGAVQGLYVLDPARCQVDEYSDTPIVTVDGEPYGPQDVIHIPGFTVPGRRAGVSVIDYARETVALGLAAEEFGARFFSQGTTMSGVIEHPTKATAGEVAVMAKMLQRSHQGVSKSHAVGVLTGGATFRPISITPNEAQFLETRKFQSQQVAMLYRVPFYMIDPSVTSSWGTGIEEQNKSYVEKTLMPLAVRLEQSLSTVLPFGQVVKWNFDALLRAKLTERFAAYATGIQNGFLCPDDVRAKEDEEPIPGGLGQAFFRPANLIELGKEPALPAQPPPVTGDQPKSPGSDPADKPNKGDG